MWLSARMLVPANPLGTSAPLVRPTTASLVSLSGMEARAGATRRNDIARFASHFARPS